MVPQMPRDRQTMTRAELIALAAPPCHECQEPVQRTECTWMLNGDGDWVPRSTWLVCTDGHRVLVEGL